MASLILVPFPRHPDIQVSSVKWMYRGEIPDSRILKDQKLRDTNDNILSKQGRSIYEEILYTLRENWMFRWTREIQEILFIVILTDPEIMLLFWWEINQ